MPNLSKYKIVFKQKIVLILLFLYSTVLFSQSNTLNNHIGLNVTLSTTNTYSNADSVSNYFREFNSWRNATYGANFVYSPPNDSFPINWPTRSTADLKKTSYKYNFDSNYTNMYGALSKKGNTIFPSFTLMHHFLTTRAVVNNFTGEAIGLDYISQQSLQRKPVPHVLDTITHRLKLAKNESYTDPNSYRYFSEYVSYLSIVYGQNIDSLTKQDVYIDADIKPFLGRNTLKYIEFANEPDAWWTWSAKEGYYQPLELAVSVSTAYDGHGGQVKTDIYNNNDSLPTMSNFDCGTLYHSPNLKIVSPGLHDINLPYLDEFLTSLDSIRAKDSIPLLDFDIYNFHHYSAYKIHDLDSIVGKDLLPDKIVEHSLLPKKYSLKVGDDFIPLVTVALESNISGYGSDKIWIHPELDGYKLRGKSIRHFLDSIGRDTSSEIWISEWGYPSKTLVGDASYYEIDPEIAHCRWMIRGFMEYLASEEIDKSFWHWYQDTDVQNWDNHCGVVTINEKRKKSWYYLKILRDQIGDKEFFMMHDVDNCGDNFAWSFDLQTVTPLQPDSIEVSCPRIYQYNGTVDSSFLDDVWTVWIPTAADLVPERKIIYLDEIISDSIDLPNSYNIIGFNSIFTDTTNISISEPIIKLDSALYHAVIKQPVLKDLNNRKYITPKVSDEPIFIHFYSDSSNIIKKYSTIDTLIEINNETLIFIDTISMKFDTSFVTVDTSVEISQSIFIKADSTVLDQDTMVVKFTILYTDIDSTLTFTDSIFIQNDTLFTTIDSTIQTIDSLFIFRDSLITILDTFTQTTQSSNQFIDTFILYTEKEIQFVDTLISISDTSFTISDTVINIIDTSFLPIITSVRFLTNDTQKPTLNLSPNPATTKILFSFENIKDNSKLIISNLKGVDILSINIPPHQRRKEVPIDLPIGIYFCRLESNDRIWEVKQLVVY